MIFIKRHQNFHSFQISHFFFLGIYPQKWFSKYSLGAAEALSSVLFHYNTKIWPSTFPRILSQGTVAFSRSCTMCGNTTALTGKKMWACRMVGIGGDFVPYSHTFDKQTTWATSNHKAQTNHIHSISKVPIPLKSGGDPNSETECLYEKKKNYIKKFNTD